MQTKLTLRLEADLITAAKTYARDRGISLSRLTTEYYQGLFRHSEPAELPPITCQLRGLLQGSKLDKQDWLDHLVEKHQ